MYKISIRKNEKGIYMQQNEYWRHLATKLEQNHLCIRYFAYLCTNFATASFAPFSSN